MRLLSKGPSETLSYGSRLARHLKKGDIVLLYGELGAGKTTFVKGIAFGLAIPERDITSASFTIIAEYEGMLHNAPVPFYHIDLYRIGDAAELEFIGIEEYLGKDGISVVEWAERLGDREDSLSVRFSILEGDERQILLEGIDEEDWNSL